MRRTVWGAMVQRVSLVLLRARAKVYEGQRLKKGTFWGPIMVLYRY